MDEFIAVLETYGVPATPRTRRGERCEIDVLSPIIADCYSLCSGIDINAGCGQLTADLMKKRQAMQPAASACGPATTSAALQAMEDNDRATGETKKKELLLLCNWLCCVN